MNIRKQVKQLLTPPASIREEDRDKARTLIYLTLSMLGVLIGLQIITAITNYLTGQPIDLRYSAIGITGMAGLLWLIRRGQLQASALGLAALWLGLTTFYASQTGFLDSAGVMGYFLPVLITGLLYDRRTTFIITFACSVPIVVLAYYQAEGNLAAINPATVLVRIAVLVVAAIFLSYIKEKLDDALTEVRQSNQRLQGLQAGLEERVAQRTSDIRLALEVSQAITQIHDLSLLLNEAVERIKSHFDLYHVQIYLADVQERNLTLRAGTGATGELLVQRGHRLPIGPGSINGLAAAEQRCIIVSDTQQDASFRPNPLLVDTRSETAVPLIADERVVGVLDLQADRPHAISETNLLAFEMLGSQLAVAIENARLFTEIAQTRREVEYQVRRLTHEGWQEYLNAIDRSEFLGYIYDQNQLQLAEQPPEPATNGEAIARPIQVSGHEVGQLRVESDAGKIWQEEEIALLDAVAGQVARQIESLRLLAEADRYRAMAEEAQQHMLREGWRQYHQARQTTAPGYTYRQGRVFPLSPENGQSDAEPAVTHPLAVRDEIVGELAVAGQLLEDEAIELIGPIAERLSAHLENLRLAAQTEQALAEVRARGEELQSINRVVSQATATFDLQELLGSMAAELLEIFSLEHVGIGLFDEAKEILTIVANRSRQPGSVNVIGVKLPIAENKATQQVLTSRQPVVVEQAQENPLTAPTHDLLKQRGTHTLVLLPLISGGEVIGTIGMDITDKERRFTDDEKRLAETIVAQISTATRNIFLFEQTQQALAETEVLYQVSAALNVAQDYEDIVAILREHTVAGEASSHVALLIFDHPWSAGQPANYFEVLSIWQAENAPPLTQERFSLDEFPAYKKLLSRDQAAAVEDLTQEPALDEQTKQLYLSALKVKSLIFTPLVVGNQWIGFFKALYPQAREFAESAVQQLTALTGQAAVALQNLRNIEFAQRRAAQVEWLTVIQSSLSQAVNEEEILTALSLAVDIDNPPDTIRLQYIDADEQGEPRYLTNVAVWRDGIIESDHPSLNQTRPIADAPLASLWRARPDRIIHLGNIAQAEEAPDEVRDWAKERDINALAIMPLHTAGRWQAVASFAWTDSHNFSVDEQFYLQQLLEPSAAVVAGRRAYLTQQAALAETEALFQASAELNLAQNYDDILTAARRHTVIGEESHIVALSLFNTAWTDKEKPRYIEVAAYWNAAAADPGDIIFNLADYPSADVILKGEQTTFIEDVATDQRLDDQARQLFGETYRSQSAIFSPLVVAGQWIGYLNAFYSHQMNLDEADFRRLESVTRQAAVATQNSRLVEQARLRAEELTLLNEMGRELSVTRQVEKIVDRVYHYVYRLVEVPDAVISLYKADIDEMTFYIYGEGERPEGERPRRRGGKGISEYVVRQKAPLLVEEDIRGWAKKHGVELAGRDAESWLGVPMMLGQDVLGVIAVQSFEVIRHFDQHDRDLLMAVAGQAAIALENVRLLEEAQARAEELAILNEMARNLATELEINTVLDNVYHYSSRLLDTTHFYIALYNEAKDEITFALTTSGERITRWSESRRSGHGLTEYLIRTRQPLLIEENVTAHIQELGIQVIGREALSWLGAPLLVGQGVVGVIAVQSYETPRLYNERHLDLLKAVASQAAIAIQNVRLFQQVQDRARREQILRQITAKVRGSVDMETIMRTAAREVGQALDRQTIIHLGDGNGDLTDE